MVTKRKGTAEKEVKKGRVKVGKLKLNKETVKDLSATDRKQVKGGAMKDPGTIHCVTVVCDGAKK